MHISKYQWILFDADETLFHFDAFAGLKLLFSHYNVQFSEADYDHYQKVNKPLWVEYQNGTIDAKTLQTQRFDEWGQKLSVSPDALNHGFLMAMADICQPLPGAKSLIDSLKGKVKLGIITNGFTQLQQVRLQRTGLSNAFSQVIISEEVGKAKPDKAIFDYAFEKMGQPNKANVLMVGDTLQSDILGGLNAGVDTCWLNSANLVADDAILPHYQVNSLLELQQRLLADTPAYK
ncbi:pyrimidine 5'-nucleotidase [Shewanella gaetbuli]|uniref:Pyrimidine 5'-nucleotidase n=1 Tax=Shewanella gaetbuli TaxID=220752 RepID=A0A9X2CHI5_9GAMM|nr:pyrimidine 5'-nucleotidase [Shewanella gaetbuli]MCL1143538.1 pyrimidine 5'-nucleotidase [Shewanella gaetbuli]